ncbi:MAG: hypothetical protein ABIR71_08910 [Chthoniobacterales bacterium]
MAREIKLSGGEITVLKAIGTSGTQVAGKLLLQKVEDAEQAEFLDTLTGLIEQGYVVSNLVNLRRIEEVERAFLRVSPAHAKDLRDAVNPSRSRERESRRERRR